MKPKFRRAVFIVTYAKKDDSILYLILKRHKNWKGWEFPKGGIDIGESERHAVIRELKEETGLIPLNNHVKKFNIKGMYKYKKKPNSSTGFVGQSYKLFAIEVSFPKYGKIKIDGHEHSTWKWFDIQKAKNKVTFNNQKDCLKIVDECVKK